MCVGGCVCVSVGGLLWGFQLAFRVQGQLELDLRLPRATALPAPGAFFLAPR